MDRASVRFSNDCGVFESSVRSFSEPSYEPSTRSFLEASNYSVASPQAFREPTERFYSSSLASPEAWHTSTYDSPRIGEAANVEDRMRRGDVVGVQPHGEALRIELLADWLFYTTNNHVLLAAVGFAHPSHPYPLNRRIQMLATSLAFAFLLASVLLIAGYALPSVPGDYSMSKTLLALLRDWPTTASVVLQLLWDVSGGSLSSCPCGRVGPPGLRKMCGFGMLCCLACQQVVMGVVFVASGAVLLVTAGLFFEHRVFSLDAARSLALLFVETKLLAFGLAVPISSLIFFSLRQAQMASRSAEQTQWDADDDARSPYGSSAPRHGARASILV